MEVQGARGGYGKEKDGKGGEGQGFPTGPTGPLTGHGLSGMGHTGPEPNK